MNPTVFFPIMKAAAEAAIELERTVHRRTAIEMDQLRSLRMDPELCQFEVGLGSDTPGCPMERYAALHRLTTERRRTGFSGSAYPCYDWDSGAAAHLGCGRADVLEVMEFNDAGYPGRAWAKLGELVEARVLRDEVQARMQSCGPS